MINFIAIITIRPVIDIKKVIEVKKNNKMSWIINVVIPQILKMSCSDKDLDIIDTLITKIDSKPIIENSIFMMSHNV